MMFSAGRAEGRAAGRTAIVTLPARTVLVAAGTTPNITYEKEAPGTFQLDAKKKFFQPHRVDANGDGAFQLVPDADGFFTSLRRRRQVRHATTATTTRATPATSSRRWRRRSTAIRTWSSCSRDELAALDPARQAAARRGVARAGRAARRRARRPRRGGRAADADHRRGDRARRRRRRGTSTRAVLPAAELRVAGAARRVDGARAAADGRHRADRRLGRQGARPAVADRARARRVEPAGRVPAARASRWS